MINTNLKTFFEIVYEQINTQIKEENNDLLSNLEQLKKELDNVVSFPDNISSFDIDNLSQTIDIDSKLLSDLNFFKKVSNSSFLKLIDDQKQKIIDSFNKFKIKIDKKIEEILIANEKYLKLKEEAINLKLILDKINNNEFLLSSDFKFLSEIIQKYEVSLENKIKLIQELSLNVCLDYEKNEELEDEQIIRITNLSETDLKELFSEFNLKFDNFKQEDKKQLLQYGILYNIKSILNILKENNIHLNISSNSSKIANVLTLSNGNNVLTIINNIKEDLGSLKTDELALNEIFNAYLSAPSIFISGLKKYEVKNEGGNGKGGTSNSFIPGALNNYLLNRQLFLSLGIDINAAMKKTSSIFTQSNRRLKTNLHYFESYGIDKSIFVNALSSMVAGNPLDLIDQFIEAGPDCYDYIINCFSQTKLGINSPELYQLINAKKSGWPENEIYRYVKSGNKTQKQRRKTNLEKLSGNTLIGEPQYNVPVDNIFLNIDFSNQESIDDKVINNYFIKQLEENFKHDELTYNFNGIIISRYKVLRYYAILLHNQLGGRKAIEFSIFKNKILNKQEYETIITCLAQVFDKDKNIIQPNQAKNSTKIVKNNLNIMPDNLPFYLKNIGIEGNGSYYYLVRDYKFTPAFDKMFIIQYLDNNFSDLKFTNMYNFSGVLVSKYLTKLCLADLISKNSVSNDLLNAIIRAISDAFNLNGEKLTQYQVSKIKQSLNKINDVMEKINPGRKI